MVNIGHFQRETEQNTSNVYEFLDTVWEKHEGTDLEMTFFF